MDAFADALDALFVDPNLGEDAIWLPGGAGSGLPIRVVRRSPNLVERFGDSRALLAGLVVDVRRSETVGIAEGDTMRIDDTDYHVIAVPAAGGLGYVFAVELAPT